MKCVWEGERDGYYICVCVFSEEGTGWACSERVVGIFTVDICWHCTKKLLGENWRREGGNLLSCLLGYESSVALCCCLVLSDSLRLHELQHARLTCPTLSPRVCSNSYPLSQWCYLVISSSASPFSICFQSFPASGSFPVSRLFASGGQSIGASALAWVLPVNNQGWFPLWLTGFISLQSKGLTTLKLWLNASQVYFLPIQSLA